jgi:serine/threonine-protein kinase HipA
MHIPPFKGTATLPVFWEDFLVGKIACDPQGLISFTYAPEWLASGSPAISLSLPKQSKAFTETAHNFFANLLPEGDYRHKIERLFQISSANDFSLLSAIGGDCAGALSVGLPLDRSGKAYYKNISSEELARIVQSEGLQGLKSEDESTRLSLAGAQGKLPIAWDGELFKLPCRGAPSTHILKFNRANGEYSRLVENEYFLTRTAHHLGLVTITCFLKKINKQVFFVSERFDRINVKDQFPTRLHQEDFCQALGRSPQKKYEKEGGPQFGECLQLARAHLSLPEVEQLITWYFFNLMLGNSDAHAKNISILYDQDGRKKLAPFYDLVCTRAYPRLDRNLAMAISGKFDPDTVHFNDLEKFAHEIGITPRFARTLCQKIIEKIPAAIAAAKIDVQHQGFTSQQMQHIYQKVESLLRSIILRLGN